MASMPHYIWIGPYRWTIERFKEDIGVHGSVDVKNQTIKVAVDQEVQQQKDTFIHELLHAIMHTNGLAHRFGADDGVDEEDVCWGFTPWLYSVIKDNSALIDWLTSD
jgi:hypothetical protein